MKTTLKIAILTAILLILAGGMTSCEKEEIHFIEYPLIETSCQWTNLKYDNSVFVVNNNNDLKKYISCMDGKNHPHIDFSKYTLLLASGTAYQNIVTMNLSLEQHSKNRYQLNVEIRLGAADVVESWILALLVEKIGGNSRVGSNVKIIKN